MVFKYEDNNNTYYRYIVYLAVENNPFGPEGIFFYSSIPSINLVDSTEDDPCNEGSANAQHTTLKTNASGTTGARLEPLPESTPSLISPNIFYLISRATKKYRLFLICARKRTQAKVTCIPSKRPSPCDKNATPAPSLPPARAVRVFRAALRM